MKDQQTAHYVLQRKDITGWETVGTFPPNPEGLELAVRAAKARKKAGDALRIAMQTTVVAIPNA